MGVDLCCSTYMFPAVTVSTAYRAIESRVLLRTPYVLLSATIRNNLYRLCEKNDDSETHLDLLSHIGT